jgi:predicted nucleic acid-binding protein
MSAERATYVDSSAIVKLVVREPESAALGRFLRTRRPLVSSALARVEVERACLAAGDAVRDRAREVIARFELVRINERVLTTAASLLPSDIRSLDAIHLASASILGPSLRAVVTYDDRMAAAARGLGWKVFAPRV